MIAAWLGRVERWYRRYVLSSGIRYLECYLAEASQTPGNAALCDRIRNRLGELRVQLALAQEPAPPQQHKEEGQE